MEQSPRAVVVPAIRSYEPFRSSLLTQEQLKPLATLKPSIVVRDSLRLWAQIVVCWLAVANWPSLWLVLAVIPLIGTRYYALFIIGHDGLHRRLFQGRTMNDLWNDIFILAPIFAITRLNRKNHMRHHAELAMPTDPDRFKYVRATRPDRFALIAGLTGLPFLFRALKNVFAGESPSARESAKNGYSLRDFAVLGSCQCALMGGLSHFIGWWAYPVLWLLPVYVFTFAADLTRVFLEHASLLDDEDADKQGRLATFVSNPLERSLLAPMNMNFHAAHHLWPYIPYYSLPNADALMRASPSRDDTLAWRRSYAGYMIAIIRSLPWRNRSILAGT